MEYKYRVYEEVYNDMISGKKTIEFRLLNEKSEKINIDDMIKFEVVDDENKYVITKIENKYIYNNVDELWNTKDTINNVLNYSKDEFIEALNSIFGKDKVEKSKLVGFKFKVIDYQ